MNMSIFWNVIYNNHFYDRVIFYENIITDTLNKYRTAYTSAPVISVYCDKLYFSDAHYRFSRHTGGALEHVSDPELKEKIRPFINDLEEVKKEVVKIKQYIGELYAKTTDICIFYAAFPPQYHKYLPGFAVDTTEKYLKYRDEECYEILQTIEFLNLLEGV